MKPKTLHIMMGLPGSGKTTYVRENRKNGDDYISLDNAYTKISKFDYAGIVAGERFSVSRYDVVWIDGLILTVEHLKLVLSSFIEKMNELSYMFLNDPVEINIVIHQFDGNREYCKNNDVKRCVCDGERSELAESTIEYVPYEIVSESDMKDISDILKAINMIEKFTYKLEYEALTVKRYGNWDKFFKPTYASNPNILASETWSLGGTWCSYDGRCGTIKPDETPDFSELDDILTTVCPNLSMLMYKKIYRDYVDVKQKSESDYYGGSEYIAWYEADMRGIYNYLRENNVIDE